MVPCHLVLCHFVHLPNGTLVNSSCASWSFSISFSDGVVPFQIVHLAVGPWTINYVLFNIIIHNYTCTHIGPHNQIITLRRKKKQNKNKNKKTYKFQFGSCNRHSAPCVTIFWNFSMHFSIESLSFYETAFGLTFSVNIEILRYGYANSATTILS